MVQRDARGVLKSDVDRPSVILAEMQQMTHLRCLPLAALALLLIGSPTSAEEQPQRMPMRDVDISYKITRPNHPPITERVRWSAAEHLQRIDGPNRSSSIFNHNGNEVTLLNGANHTYRKLEGAPRSPIESELGVLLKRDAESIVAGFRCIDWSWIEDVETHTACLTPDGVLLRLVVDGKTTVEARTVTYHQQPPELFEVPKNYAPALAPEGGVDP
jgi:hypothetical protein